MRLGAIRPLTPLYELYFRLLRENAITCKLNFCIIRCNRFLLTTIPRDCNKDNYLLYPQLGWSLRIASIAIRICRSGSTRSKRCYQYIYVAFGKHKAARISVSLNSLRRLLMILAALSFSEHPRGTISSIRVIVFPVLKYELALVLILFSSFGYEIQYVC